MSQEQIVVQRNYPIPPGKVAIIFAIIVHVLQTAVAVMSIRIDPTLTHGGD